MSISVQVTVRGRIFAKNISGEVKKAIINESLEKIDKRLSRRPPRKKLGMMRNPVKTRMDAHALKLHFEHVESRFHSPRRTGKAWLRKNIAIVKAMAPRVLRKTAARIIGER